MLFIIYKCNQSILYIFNKLLTNTNNMKKITLSRILFILICIPSFILAQQKNSQEAEKCLTDTYNAKLLATNPNMMGSELFKNQLNA